MIQIRSFDPTKGGNTIGRCLGNVRAGYDIPPKYNNAREAWQHAIQHPDRNFPVGVAVPIFWEFTYHGEHDGHVAVRMPDGRIWTDGRYFANVNELNAYYLHGEGKYLGWTEDLNDVRVVQEGDNMIDDSYLRGLVIRILRLTRRGTSEKQIETGINIIKSNKGGILIGIAEWLDGIYNAPWFKAQTAKINAPPVNYVPYTGEKLYVERKKI